MKEQNIPAGALCSCCGNNVAKTSVDLPMSDLENNLFVNRHVCGVCIKEAFDKTAEHFINEHLDGQFFQDAAAELVLWNSNKALTETVRRSSLKAVFFAAQMLQMFGLLKPDHAVLKSALFSLQRVSLWGREMSLNTDLPNKANAIRLDGYISGILADIHARNFNLEEE